MAVVGSAVTKAFDVLTRKLQKLGFSPDENTLGIDENSSSSSYDYFINDTETTETRKYYCLHSNNLNTHSSTGIH